MSEMNLETVNKLYLELSQVTTAKTGTELRLLERIDHLTDLLRSAHAIARRNGEGTAWVRFAEKLSSEGIGSVTARVFKVLPSDNSEDQQFKEVGE